MNTFNSTEEKLDFLKRYKLASPKETDIPILYYYASGADTPITCEVIGYEEIYDSWAVVTIKAGNNTKNIHSSYLLDMKKRGTEYQNNISAYSEDISSSGFDSYDSYVVFDIETTGLNRNKDEIIEIAAIKCAGDNIIEFHQYVKVDSVIPTHITALTDISNFTLQDADPINLVLPKFLSFIGNCKLVGHCIRTFDVPFINKFCDDLGLPQIKNTLEDTLPLAREKLSELDDHKLSTVCEYYEIDTSNAHHALDDCYMCRECYLNLLDDQEVDLKLVNNIDNPFEQQIMDILNNIMSIKQLPPDSLFIYSNVSKKGKVTSKTLCIFEPPYPLTEHYKMKFNSKYANFRYTKTGDVKFRVKDVVIKHLSIPEHIPLVKGTSKQDQKHTYIILSPDDSFTLDCIKSSILITLSHYMSEKKSFGCCSKFNQCSDAKECVHENKLYSTACAYRRNLENGRIFYGKNRNID